MGAVEVYRKTRKVPDLVWNAYVCRPLAAVVVSWVQGTRITPNQITLFAFVVAAGAAALLGAWPGYVGLVVGAAVFELSYVLDCADGMLARWRGTASAEGHLLDFLMDELKAFLILAAVSVRLFREHDDARLLLVGLGGLVALASGIALTTFLRRPEIARPTTASARRKTLVRRVAGWGVEFARLLIHYPSYFLFAALAGHMEWYLFPYVAVNALYALAALAGVARRFGAQNVQRAAAPPPLGDT
jgi:phosphatidylglycerophosphate synthase